MTPCVASVALLLALLRAALVPAEAHAHHRHHSAQAPPGSDTPDNLSITPAAAARKCGHQPLPLEERLQKAAELAPALARIRHSRDVATSWPTTRRHLHTADSPASNGVVIDVYWHIVTGTGAQLECCRRACFARKRALHSALCMLALHVGAFSPPCDGGGLCHVQHTASCRDCSTRICIYDCERSRATFWLPWAPVEGASCSARATATACWCEVPATDRDPYHVNAAKPCP